jgi:hypothetical protein
MYKAQYILQLKMILDVHFHTISFYGKVVGSSEGCSPINNGSL